MLPNEIWAVILKYLNYVDILSIKLLSKRCFNITFLNTRFKYFQGLAKQLTDCSLYYQEINAFFDEFIQKVKSDISLSDCLYLNYLFYQLKGNLMLSSCFCHLFHCPRSVYAKNNCLLCSRKFISEFDQLFSLIKDRLKNQKLLDLDAVECLDLLANDFLKVFLRILVNVCCDFDLSESEKLIFLQKFSNFVISRIPDIIAKFNFKIFKIDYFRFRFHQREAIMLY